jgi:hypothetical protein
MGMSGCSANFESFFEEPASEYDRAVLQGIVSRLSSRKERRRNAEQCDNTFEAGEDERGDSLMSPRFATHPCGGENTDQS